MGGVPASVALDRAGLDGLLLVVGEERVLGRVGQLVGGRIGTLQEQVGQVVVVVLGRCRREQRGEPGRLVVDRPARPVLEERVELAAVGETFDLLAGQRLEGRPSTSLLGRREVRRRAGPARISLPMMTFSPSPIR